ncbi:MAG: hypothetical protein L3K09_01665 [Thermoplasmata archaeon]|nr:hypothetical protein [Thermoplasmata archaeon]
MVLMLLLLSAMPAGAGTPYHTYSAPYHGGILPTSSLTTYSCRSSAIQTKAWHFNLKTGFGGGSDSVAAHACNQSQYRLGAQSSASASGGEEVSVAIKVPSGTLNVSANVTFAYTAAIRAAVGTLTGACPTTGFNSTSASYYDGSGWSYWPTLNSPIVYSNHTYFYYYHNGGASGSCSSFASVDAGLSGFMVASNGLAGYSLTPSAVQVGGYVWITNSTYWNCYNYTLWSYGGWYNNSGSCSSSNQTQTQSCVYSCSWPTIGSFVPTMNMTFLGSSTFTMWASQNFSASASWDLFINPFASLQVYTYGFPKGSALSTVNMATLGNGVTLRSITVT